MCETDSGWDDDADVQLCLTLWDPMDCSMPGFSVLHHLPELAQTHVHWIGDAIQPSRPLLSSLSPPALSLFKHQGLFLGVVFPSGGQNNEASASAPVLPMNIHGWFPLGLTSLISLQSKLLSRVFFNTPVQKHQFFSAQLPGASTRDPTLDKVMRRRPNKQGRSGP